MARRLKTPTDCRRYIASLINRVESGELEAQKASKLGYLANILCKSLEFEWESGKVAALADKLDELEDGGYEQVPKPVQAYEEESGEDQDCPPGRGPGHVGKSNVWDLAQ